METSAALLRPVPQDAAKSVKTPFLLSPSLDVLLIGGLSILAFAVAYLCVDKQSSTTQISWAAFYLAFAVNNPHFMASYILLYKDKRRELFTNWKFTWAAFVAPALILGYMGVCIAVASPRFLGYAVNFMYFTVGWHYIKQIYGTVVVTNARRGYYFTPNEGRFLKANLYPVWMLSFLNGNLAIRDLLQYGVGYKTFAVPSWLLTVDYVLVAVSLVAVVSVLFRKWIQTGKRPGWAAIASVAAIYVWYLPAAYHPHFWYLIPFFHSLQYLLFVGTMKKNQFTAEAEEASADAAARRAAFAKRFFGFAALVVVLGALTFEWIPDALDAVIPYDHSLFGPTLFMFLFITFINIHHYFIDNVIWRRDNPALKKHLFA